MFFSNLELPSVALLKSLNSPNFDCEKLNPDVITLKIEIGGHTDNSGLEKDNEDLSKSRAKSVNDYIVSKGIAAERLTYKGYAASKPIADNKTAEGKAKNRRTEFIVTGI